ncbi:MAG: phage tail protein I [Candidatus Dormiibacterota bacterium]
MRALVPGLTTPHPLGRYLPALFQEDPFALGLVAGLDEVLSPLLSCLDNLSAYIDPALAPDDFLSWLAGWLGVELDDGWPEERRRAILQRAVDLHRMRGTAEGLRLQLELLTGGQVEIAESGGVAWSRESGTEMPGEPQPRMTIRVTVDDMGRVDPRALDRLIAESKPAHVVHQLEVAAP